MLRPVRRFAVAASLMMVGCGGETVTVNLVSYSGGEQTGMVTLSDRGDDTEVVIETQGGSDNNDQLAHIRTESCDVTGAPSGVVLENLEPVRDNRSTTLLTNRRLADLRSGTYHVEIKNSADPTQVNSCGNIP